MRIRIIAPAVDLSEAYRARELAYLKGYLSADTQLEYVPIEYGRGGVAPKQPKLRRGLFLVDRQEKKK